MNLPGLFFLFALYTLLVAAAAIVVVYVSGQRKRGSSRGLPIPNITGLNVKSPAERHMASWKAEEAIAQQDPAPAPAIPFRRIAPPPPRAVEWETSAGTGTPDAVQAAPVVAILEMPRTAEVATLEPAIEMEASIAPLDAAVDGSPANPFAQVFGADGALLPEGLRTLEVAPSRQIEPGTTVHAAFTVRNPGGGTATGFRARFRLPEGLAYAPGSARIDDVPLEDNAGQTALLEPAGADIGNIPAGGERRVSVAFIVAGTIENRTSVALQAAVASPDVTVIGSNVVRLAVRSCPVLQNAQTTLGLTALRAALPGEELQLSARIHNSGQSSAHDLMVLLPVPAHTTFATHSITVDGRPFAAALPNASFGFSRPTVIAPVLAPNAGIEIGYRVRIDTPLEDATPIVAHATVCSQEVAEFSLEPITLEIPSTASFEGDETSLRIECADEVEPGERLRIVLCAKNVGTASARDLCLEIALPTGMAYTAGSLTIDGALAPDRGTVPQAIRLGDLGPSRTVDIALTAIVQSPIPDGQRLRPSAKVSWSKGERNFACDIVARSAPRFPADFNTIERESAQRVGPGDPLCYTIALANMGTDTATSVCVKLAADPGLQSLVVRDGDAELALADDLTLALEPLEPGVSRLLRVFGRVADIIEDQTQLRLAATLATAQTAPVVLGSQSHVVGSRPRFSLTSSRLIVDGSTELRLKRATVCRVLLVNEGTDCARNVRVVMQLPDELQLETVENATRDGDAIVFGDIPARERREAVLTTRLVGIVGAGDWLALSARVSGENVVPFGLAPIELATHAEASFSEGATLTSVPLGTVDAGAELGYTLSFWNSGDGAAKVLAARIGSLTNAVYAQGSTTVNGIALQDHAGTSLLLTADGLRMADVGAGVKIVATWRVIVNMPLPPDTAIDCSARISWNDAEIAVWAQPVSVRSTSALPIIDPELPFSVLGAIAARKSTALKLL